MNQYTAVTTPGYENILGVAIATNAVTVDGGACDRKGEYFHREITVANSSGPLWQTTTVSCGGSSSNGGFVFPKNSQSLSYDDDGNLKFDGVWLYGWDSRNRLVEMVMTNTVAGIPTNFAKRIQFTNDFNGRRISKTVTTWSNITTTTRFVYDGWNLVAELDDSGNAVRTYVWGQDLSGTTDGAGGIGGLVVVRDVASATNHFVAFDGNGNVTGLVAQNGAESARYEYGPFGEVIRVTGFYAAANPFRWSTKFTDEETGLSYYGLRYYSAALGRWTNRDPMQEHGGPNLLAFIFNRGINAIDSLGGTPITTSDGYELRLDQFNTGGEAHFEIHVSYKGNEQGIFTRDGFINKHGISGALADANIPEHIQNKVNGMAVDYERRAGRIPERGRANIKNGAWRGGGANLRAGQALILVGAIMLAANGDAVAAELGNATVNYLQMRQGGASTGDVDLAAIEVALAVQNVSMDGFLMYTVLDALLE